MGRFVSWRFLDQAYWPCEPMKIGIFEAVGSNHSSMYDTGAAFSNASPEWLAATNFTRWPRSTRARHRLALP